MTPTWLRGSGARARFPPCIAVASEDLGKSQPLQMHRKTYYSNRQGQRLQLKLSASRSIRRLSLIQATPFKYQDLKSAICSIMEISSTAAWAACVPCGTRNRSCCKTQDGKEFFRRRRSSKCWMLITPPFLTASRASSDPAPKSLDLTLLPPPTRRS
jgi:hypothetical protein